MISPITAEVIENIGNPALAAYAQRYLQIAQDYQDQIRQTGIQIATPSAQDANAVLRDRLKESGATFRNDDRSIVLNRISPACEACQTGAGSATFFISLRCHRSCFYCFNPNQEAYDHHREHLRDPAAELEQIHAAHKQVKTLALTGGEPLLYKDETYRFFRTARQLFPHAHTRLYTCGDHADEATLGELKASGLNEIRFSIRMHDLEKDHRTVFGRIANARKYIPQVMVEMPVLPGTQEKMKEVLLELDGLDIYGINLLEFCYPLWNTGEYNRRGYAIKNPPHRIVYDYWYAGGLPVQGSEEVCLDLLAFALEKGLKLGVHYCSLENKHTGQIYQQNIGFKENRLYTFSQRDFFLKSAKVFGDDIAVVQALFKRQGFRDWQWNEDHQYLEFPLRKIFTFRKHDFEVAVAYHVVETRGLEKFLREVHLDLAHPETFVLEEDA